MKLLGKLTPIVEGLHVIKAFGFDSVGSEVGSSRVL